MLKNKDIEATKEICFQDWGFGMSDRKSSSVKTVATWNKSTETVIISQKSVNLISKYLDNSRAWLVYSPVLICKSRHHGVKF